MNTSRLHLVSVAAALLLLVTAGAHAQSSSSSDSSVAASCAGCHGAKGEGNPQSGFPRLAGQPQDYLEHQLASYANGSRNNQVMTPIAKQLSDKQRAEVAAYYASLSAPQAKAPSTPSGQSQKRGQTLATLGDEHLGVQACANCHGPNGAGEPPTYPYLAGQNIHYLNTAMDEWKSGARKTDPSEQMPMIARQLSRSDMASLAAYFASQPVPVPATQRTNIPLGSASHPVASGSTSHQKSVPTTGVSTEQGSPTEGGSQGPGGGGGASGSGPSGTPKSGQ